MAERLCNASPERIFAGKEASRAIPAVHLLDQCLDLRIVLFGAPTAIRMRFGMLKDVPDDQD